MALVLLGNRLTVFQRHLQCNDYSIPAIVGVALNAFTKFIEFGGEQQNLVVYRHLKSLGGVNHELHMCMYALFSWDYSEL